MYSPLPPSERRTVARKRTLPAAFGLAALLTLPWLLTACGGSTTTLTEPVSRPEVEASHPIAEATPSHAAVLPTAAELPAPVIGVSWPDPARLAKDIEKFEAADQTAFPPAGAVLAVGSSSIRGWHRTIEQDLSPLTIIPRGFGGSTMYDLAHYADRVIFPYKPRAILIYEGDNDIAAGIPPVAVLQTFADLVRRIHGRLPGTRVYVLAVKPSPSRWKWWNGMSELNAMLRAACEKNPWLDFIDVATPMLDDQGKPRPELYIGDRLHLSAEGYALWTRVVREVLLEKELPHEKREP